MKIGKRLAALAAAFALAVLLVPGAAFASGTSATATPAPTTAASTASPTAAPTATPEPTGAPNPAISSINSYAIGTGEGTGFAALTTVPAYTSDLTLRVYFSGTPSTLAGSRAVSVHDCNFVGQSSHASFHVDKSYFDVVNLKYNSDSGNKFTATLDGVGDFSFSIGECQVKVAEPAATTEPTPTPVPTAPGLIVKSSSIGTDSVNAGDAFTLSLTVYATTSGKANIEDVVVSVQPAEKGVVITSGSSTQYIGTMKPGTSKTVAFPMQAQADFTDGVSVIAVSLTGTGAQAFSTNISVPVNQPDRFEISKVEVPASLMVGQDDVATVTFVNKGKNPVGNLSLSLAATNIAEPSQTQYVGNLAAGTEDSVDFDLSPSDAGDVSGTITVTYEAANGKTVTLTQDLSATVEAGADAGMSGDMGMSDMPADGGSTTVQPALPTWAIALILIGAAVVLIVVILVVRRHKAKKKAQLEAEDEDL